MLREGGERRNREERQGTGREEGQGREAGDGERGPFREGIGGKGWRGEGVQGGKGRRGKEGGGGEIFTLPIKKKGKVIVTWEYQVCGRRFLFKVLADECLIVARMRRRIFLSHQTRIYREKI